MKRKWLIGAGYSAIDGTAGGAPSAASGVGCRHFGWLDD